MVQYYGNLIDGGGDVVAPTAPSTPTTSTTLTPDQITDPYKQILWESINTTNYDLEALLAEAEAEIALAEALSFETEARAAELEADVALAEAAVAEGDKAVATAEYEFNKAFYADPNATFSDLSKNMQTVASKGLFGGNASLTALYSMLSSIGVEGLVDVMEKIRAQYPEASSEEMLMLLKYDKRYNEPYMARFSGNKARIAAGLAPLDDATYLANEAAYKKIFETYGLKQFANREKYANFIGNNVSPDEIANRVQVVYERVNQSLPEVKRALLQLYPELTSQDLMAYALDPVNQLPAITRKVQAAEVGGAALTQGLGISLASQTFTGTEAAPFTNVQRGTIGVEAMLQSGATKETAGRASQFVASVLPRGEFLSSIYADGYDQYGQLQAEQEAYQGLASAERARQRLIGREVAEFRGSAGTSRVSFASESKGNI